MKYPSTLHRFGLLSAALLLSAGLAACGKEDSQNASSNPSTEAAGEYSNSESAPTDEPFVFSEALVPLSGSSNLYSISSSVLADDIYYTACDFDGQLLLIENLSSTAEEETVAVDGETAAEDPEGSDSFEEEYDPSLDTVSYRFYLYDPQTDQIRASLDTAELDTSYDNYQVVGSHLVLQNYRSCDVAVYDKSLQPVTACNLPFLFEECSSILSGSPRSSLAYTYSYSQQVLVRFDLENLSWEAFPLSIDSVTIAAVSEDDSQLLLTGCLTDSWEPCWQLLETESFTITEEGTDSLWEAMEFSADHVVLGHQYGDWEYRRSGEDSIYFEDEDISSFRVLSDGSLVMTGQYYSQEEESWVYKGLVYNTDKELTSAFSYEIGGDLLCGEAYYLEEENCFLFLRNREDGGNDFLIWKLSDAFEMPKEETEFYDSLEMMETHGYIKPEPGTYEEDGSTITMIPDPDSYDWGRLAGLREKADALEETYGIEIYLGQEVPPVISDYLVDGETNYKVLVPAMEELEKLFASYPEDFFQSLCTEENSRILIYLGAGISGREDYTLSDPAAFVSSGDGLYRMVLDCEQYSNWDYIFNHELSHIIDSTLEYYCFRRSDALYSFETWNSLLPDGFEYAHSYQDYENNPAFEEYGDYFVDIYGMTTPGEDRAQLFGTAMEISLGMEDWNDYFTEGSLLIERYRYYCEAIRHDLGSEDWPKVMPWEEVLQ